MLLLDTDHLTLTQRRGSQYVRLSERLSPLSPEQVATTVIRYEEQTRGWMAYMSRTRTVAEQIDAYGRLLQHIENFRRIKVVPFDSLAATYFQRLIKSRPRLGTMDLKIAAIALSLDATLLSRNLADFRRVAGLKVEDWTT